MAQGLSVSSVTATGGNGFYGSSPLWWGNSKMMEKPPIASGIERRGLGHHSGHKLFSYGHSDLASRRRIRAEAGWLFKGGEEGLDARSERSESANEDILIFFFQLDLATRVQCALNMDQYEIAQQLRNKLTEVETEVIKQRDSIRGSTSKSEAQDKAICLLRLRADMQNAIEKEDYASAAELRDKISRLEAESLAATAKVLAYENAKYAFRLGQKVTHKIYEASESTIQQGRWEIQFRNCQPESQGIFECIIVLFTQKPVSPGGYNSFYPLNLHQCLLYTHCACPSLTG